jgi:hypothetical protein
VPDYLKLFHGKPFGENLDSYNLTTRQRILSISDFFFIHFTNNLPDQCQTKKKIFSGERY